MFPKWFKESALELIVICEISNKVKNVCTQKRFLSGHYDFMLMISMTARKVPFWIYHIPSPVNILIYSLLITYKPSLLWLTYILTCL